MELLSGLVDMPTQVINENFRLKGFVVQKVKKRGKEISKMSAEYKT
jgi:hypothetical protein